MIDNNRRGGDGIPAPDGKLLAALNRAGASYSALAHRFGLTRGQVSGLIARAKKSNPAWFNVNLGSHLQLVGNYMVVGDVHVPVTDYDFAQLVVRVAEHFNIRGLIIAGDFFNMDMFSSYPKDQAMVSWEQEREAGKVLLLQWLEWFSEIYTLMGNHDRRVIRFVEGQFDENDIYGMLVTSSKLVHSHFGWCEVRSNGVPWRITHPRNYSRNQLVTASELALKHKSNIVSFHEHHAGKGWDKYNRYVVINGGILADQSKMGYVTLDDGNNPIMKKGFAMIKDGVGEIFSTEPYTDWSFLSSKPE